MAFTLTGARDDIAGALGLASRFTAAHKSTPQLNQLRLIVNDKGDSYVEATDQRSSIRTALWAQSGEEVDVMAHPELANAVKAMPAGEITITQDGTKLVVAGKGRSKYSVGTLDGDPIIAFPGEDEMDWSNTQPIDATEALAIMSVAARYVAKQESNPSIIGVNLRVDKATDMLAIESTDGARLFHDKVKLPDPGFPFQEEEVMLPPRMVNELGKVFPTGEVSFAANANLFFARDPQGETTFASRRIGGKFPDVTKILPKFDHTLTVPRQDLADALSRMGSVVKGKPVQLSFKEKELHLQSRTGTGSAEEFIDLSTPAPAEIAIAFNLEYLADAISLFSADELRIAVSTPLRPVQIRDLGERFFLLAPVKF